MLKKNVLLLCFILQVIALGEVTVSIVPNGKQLTFKWNNSAALPYYLGGVRFFTDGYVHPNLNNMTNWTFDQKSVGTEKEQTLLYKSSIATVQVIPSNGSTSANTLADYSGNVVQGAKRHELLLKTGSAGKVDDPITEEPIDTSDIDSLIKTPDFYNKDYRYIDTLGAHGGLYSGGIMDTWLGETQVICHFSDKKWPLHKTEKASFTLSATGGDPLFWMSVIMGQEYFHVDMQWMLGKGAQETGAGTGSYNGTNGEGAFGPWEVETGTGKSREIAYPYFFEHGTITNFWSDSYSHLNSPNVVNGYIYSVVCVRYMYDLWNYATDACWKEILLNSESRYYALSILLGGYNNGIGDAQSVLKPFWHVDSYKNYVANPNSHDDVEATMNKGYVPGVIGGVKNLEEGSKAAYLDKSLELIDMELSLTDINRFFYGEGGDKDTQGDGGLLAHFKVDRNAFDLLIQTAFRKLKGKAPSTQGKDAISLRYDFLTLLRVVKRDFQITWVRPTGPGEWITAVKQQSQKDECDSLKFDNEYPYGEISGTPTYVTDFKVDIHGWDNQMVEDVCWTIDSSWSKWNKATYKSGSNNDQIFTITIPDATIKATFGSKDGTYWYMVSDASGNSVVKKGLIKSNKIEPVLDSAIALDSKGDGMADHIKVYAKTKSKTVSLLDYKNPLYSWPTNSNLKKPDNVSINGDTLTMTDPLLTSGEGRGKVEFSLGGVNLEGNIEDRIGPALVKAACVQKDQNRPFDTLHLSVSEELKDNFQEQKYLIVFRDSSDIQGDTITVRKVTVGGNFYNFMVDLNYVSNGDWLQFVAGSGIEDKKGNSPLVINQKVQLNVLGNTTPEVTTSEMYDVYGNQSRVDGDGDSLYVSLNLAKDPKALTVDSLKEIEFTWGGVTRSVPKSSIKILSKSSFSIVDKSLKGGSGSGKLTLLFTSGIKVHGKIDDKIAPVIKKAEYYKWHLAKDTLVVTFNEELSSSGTNSPFIVTASPITVHKISTNGKAVTYAIENSVSLSYDDSIWIAGNEKVIDLVKNEQVTDSNVKVPFKYKNITKIENAAYFETDSRPDGFIDLIKLYFATEIGDIAQENFKNSIVLPKERSFLISKIEKSGSKTLLLHVDQDANSTSALTSIQVYDTLSMNMITVNDTLSIAECKNMEIMDSLAPVIVSARFSPSGGNVVPEIDTLKITYSEQVQKSINSEPFRFSDASSNNSEYSLSFQNNLGGIADVIYTNVYNSNNVLPVFGDSLWIYDNGDIEDITGILQNKNTIPVPLVVGLYQRNFKVSLSPIPFDIGLYNDSSVTIRIQPGTRKLPEDIQAEFVMFDKVGNVVKTVSKNEFGKIENEMLAYSFKPRNSDGRRLGVGSYLIQLQISTGDITVIEPLYLGLKSTDTK